jgi:CDP-diacylglycerol--glycerol-3-phosphate 3-phosphatidyltransferase
VPRSGRPLITANQVTLARLIPMPLLSWLIYQGAEGGYEDNRYMWSALIAGTLIGCTDWIDGVLARKQGPTVLGGLLDPIADKVFIVFAYTPFADDILGRSLVPWWACALMFVRELFITALRSAYEQRGISMKTSYLAKAKTWTQMQGIGVMLLFPLLGPGSQFLTWLLVAGVAAPIVATVVLWIVKRKLWRGALVMSVSFAPILGLHLHGDIPLTVEAIMIGVVAITWISGIDYVVIGWPKLRARGDFSRADAVRLIGALAMPVLLFGVLVKTDAPAWPVFLILSLELAAGGLDNLLSHHKKATPALIWGGRVLGISALLGGALALPGLAAELSIVAAVVSGARGGGAVWGGRGDRSGPRVRATAGRAGGAAAPPPGPGG